MNLYGIWIDHAHALIVKAQKNGEMTISEITSEVEPHHHSGTQQGEHFTITDQDHENQTRAHEMNAFCKMILSHLQDAEEIVVFGPSTAKHELKHAIEAEKSLHNKLKAVETTDKLTEAELKDFVMKAFHLPRE